MSQKQLSIRYEEGDTVDKWLSNQKNKKASLRAVIQTIVANYGDGDYIEGLAFNAILTNGSQPMKKTVTSSVADSKKATNLDSKPVTVRRPIATEDDNEPTSSPNDDDSKSDTPDLMNMFSDL
ncbi:hypothetical protein FOD75_10700 (plasmid) [Limosilactobacillus reuteri]|uniref:Uncharacterized protein n=1 Tax=Limosilactobacillus reuteri TaxID=1598 RepID=A0A517D883_LIMRT|nr:hypothetical protein [Limosilactobacillus reuteri]QDR73560.1 hypothetical protein FOD75_10700 [Limosilactobacillus reuteri]